MLEYLLYFIFIFTVAFAAGGVVLSNRLRSSYKHDFLSNLMYYQVFIYTFGFYGLWGQVIISVFMKDYLSAATLARLSDITIFLGLPFLVFAWMMMLRFTGIISGRKTGNRFIVLFLLINFSVIFTFGYLITNYPGLRAITFIKYYYISFSTVYWLYSGLLLLFPSGIKNESISINRRFMAAVIIGIMIIQNIILCFYSSETYLAMAFIFVFFSGNLFIPLYMSYGATYNAEKKDYDEVPDFGQFCLKYEISPREKDIITAICKGLSNKEIADSLFISLQTVKDHTHRIYIKTNVKSRVNLINLVRVMMLPQSATGNNL